MENKNSINYKFKPGTVLHSDYVIDKFLSKGGMNSEIYLGHIKSNDKIITSCLKVIYITDKTNLKKIDQEIKTSLRLSNNKKNIVKTFSSWIDEENMCICVNMEYLPGTTLKKYLIENGPIYSKIAVKLFKEILIGVQSLHSFSQKIIHRDLKPENIILSEKLDKVTIFDFGISSVVEKKDASNSEKCISDESGDFYGTYPYVIPDVLDYNLNFEKAAQAGVTVEFDFYALGVILYEMLMGKKPFLSTKEQKPADVIRLATRYDIKVISNTGFNIPSALENVIFRCLASKPGDKKYRYKNIDEIITDIDFILTNWENDEPEKNNVELIKKPNERNLQNVSIFNVNRVSANLPIYKRPIMYWTCLIVLSVLIVIFVISFLLIRK